MLELIFYRPVTAIEVKLVKILNVNGLDYLSLLPKKKLDLCFRIFLAKNACGRGAERGGEGSQGKNLKPIKKIVIRR